MSLGLKGLNYQIRTVQAAFLSFHYHLKEVCNFQNVYFDRET